MTRPKFRMGKLDHVHIRVPDRAEAARWYSEHLGFEPVGEFDFWATGFEGGPLQISADGGQTMLALFEATDGHPMIPQKTGVAFSVDAETFMSFTRSLPGEIMNPLGQPLAPNDIVDFDLCWAFDLVDPWGNVYELNCYDYDRIAGSLLAPGVVRSAANELIAGGTGRHRAGPRPGRTRPRRRAIAPSKRWATAARRSRWGAWSGSG
jgi:catechol 2,3-dioxygenase-like lactoylglutathione lyase family enzyme